MDYINVVSFENDNVFTDHNTNGPYDNLFPSLRTYLLTDELPEKYILNIATPQLNTDDINFFDFFNSNVKLLDDLKSGNAKILMNRIGEFDNFLDGKIIGLQHPKILKALDDLNVSRNNVLYLNFNSLVEEVCQDNIKVKYHNFTRFNSYSIHKKNEDLYRESFERQKDVLRKYYYLCYNNIEKPHRKFIVDFLLKRETKGLLSSSWNDIFLDDAKPPNDPNRWSQFNTNLYYYFNREHFNNSYFSIITESHYSDSTGSLNLTFTEKTWKPILNFHQFCLVGAKNSISKLKSFGFETFTELFDESYDVVDDENRVVEISKQLNNIFLMSIDEVNDIYYSIEEKLVYNFHHFFRLCEVEIKELEKYLLKFCNS